MSYSRQLLADLSLLLVTAIWGSTFVMVKGAVANFPVFSFMALRFTIAALAVLPFVYLSRRRSAPAKRPLFDQLQISGSSFTQHLRCWAGVILPSPSTCGVGQVSFCLQPLLIGLALFAGYAFQTAGLMLTTPAKTGFITGLSVVIVPLAAALFLREAPGRDTWIGVTLATLGLALLSLTANLRIAPGDLLVLGCAFSFAAHILLTGHFSARSDPLWLTFGQILTVAILSGIAAWVFELYPQLKSPHPQMRTLTSSVLFAAAFTGVLATSFAFGVQTLAQRFTSSTHTALIFAAEPVFAGLFSFLLIGEMLGPRQVLGCASILAGMLIAELKPDAGTARIEH